MTNDELRALATMFEQLALVRELRANLLQPPYHRFVDERDEQLLMKYDATELQILNGFKELGLKANEEF